MKYTYRNYKSKAKTKQKNGYTSESIKSRKLILFTKKSKIQKKKNLLKLERNLKENIFQNITN